MPEFPTRPVSEINSQFQIGGITKLVGGEMQTPRSAAIGNEIKMQLNNPNDPNKLTSTEMFGKDLVDRGGAVPIPGADIMEDLMTVEIGEDNDTTELEEVLRRAWAFREGLTLGPKGDAYTFKAVEVSSKPETKTKVKKLQNLMSTVEGSVERPRAEYVEVAIEEALDKRIREAQLYRDNPERYEAKMRRKLENNYRVDLDEKHIVKIIKNKTANLAKDYIAIPKLTELSNHSKVRATFDKAFQNRMQTCEDPGKAAKLGGEYSTPTPDGQHFETFFKGEGEYGQKVNDLFEEMVKMALPNEVTTRLGMSPVPDDVRRFVPENVYGVGFDNATMFATWMEHMLQKADGRMDIVWGAWKTALTFEVIDDLGQSINAKGKFALASPPLGNPLMTYLAHWQEKTTTEFGWDAKGKRTQKEKFVAHSGLPLTFGHVPNLCEQYFIEAKVGFDKTYLDKPWMGNMLSKVLTNIPKRGDKDYESECFARQNYFDRLREDVVCIVVNKLPKSGDPAYDKADADTKIYFDNLTKSVSDSVKTNFPKSGDPAYDKADADTKIYFDNLRTRLEDIASGREVIRDGKKLDTGKINISLWDIWLYGRISFADKDFPWFATDQAEIDPSNGELPTSGELPSGSVGMWYLTRGRSWGDRGGVGNDLKSLPMLKDLGSPDFFTSRVRTWAKVLGTVSDELPVEENVRMWWILAVISSHQTLAEKKGAFLASKPAIITSKPELDYVLSDPFENLTVNPTGTEMKGVSYSTVFYNALKCGFLRVDDVNYIKEKLNIKISPISI